ncbi:hypothetical protein KM92DES2_10639 [uncultured Desulfovibrio sp.]|uniref:Uncharacterized protein n=1 Tax=uncultured Desulfovibrio sp. TaxID=167968 RepID=A0A212J731_9BACT|nr:hypothetical protein KM92DES2_10639 [uncultured Desulfovibrio sp.]
MLCNVDISMIDKVVLYFVSESVQIKYIVWLLICSL